MRMFIWADAYDVSYGNAVGVAIAETEEEARALLLKADVSPYGMNPIMADGERHRMTGADPAKIKGPPTRVYDLPHAEIYEWSE